MKINKTENLHKHIKGSYKDYDPEVHKNAIYFAEDEEQIIVDGIEYGNSMTGAQGPKGDPGDSAYKVAVLNGFKGTETEWLKSIQGKDGKDGVDGKQGIQGIQGIQGKDGPRGEVGPQGPKGEQGKDGNSPLLRVGDTNKLEVSYNEGEIWRPISDNIAAWFRWQNSTDNLGKVQISRDNNTWENLSPDFINRMLIKGFVSELPQDAEYGDIYMVGPHYNQEDSEHVNPYYRMWVMQDTWVDAGNYNKNTYNYNYNIKKTYLSTSAMNADKNNPIGTNGLAIQIGDLVSVVNLTTPSENGIYSYEGATDGWKYQSSFNFQLEQIRSQNLNTAPSSKLFDDELVQVRSDFTDEIIIKGVINLALFRAENIVSFLRPGEVAFNTERNLLVEKLDEENYRYITPSYNGMYIYDGDEYRWNGTTLVKWKPEITESIKTIEQDIDTINRQITFTNDAIKGLAPLGVDVYFSEEYNIWTISDNKVVESVSSYPNQLSEKIAVAENDEITIEQSIGGEARKAIIADANKNVIKAFAYNEKVERYVVPQGVTHLYINRLKDSSFSMVVKKEETIIETLEKKVNALVSPNSRVIIPSLSEPNLIWTLQGGKVIESSSSFLNRRILEYIKVEEGDALTIEQSIGGEAHKAIIADDNNNALCYVDFAQNAENLVVPRGGTRLYVNTLDGTNLKIEKVEAATRIVKKTSLLSSSAPVYAPFPQQAAQGTEGTLSAENVTSDELFFACDAVIAGFPHYAKSELLGKDTSGTYDIKRYILCKSDLFAWKASDAFYCWKKNSDNIFYYVKSISPRVGDILYNSQLEEYDVVGFFSSVSGSMSDSQEKLYIRYSVNDLPADVIYTKAETSDGWPFDIYDNRDNRIKRSASPSTWSDSISYNSKTYVRHSPYDTFSGLEKTIVIWAQEHAMTSDPHECAIVVYRLIKDLCKGGASQNAFLSYLKNFCKVVILPVVNPYGMTRYALYDDGNGRVNYRGVNINRNYPTKGWTAGEMDANYGGVYGGSEVETQYVINSCAEFGADVGIDIHALSYTTKANEGNCAYGVAADFSEKVKDVATDIRNDYDYNLNSYGESNAEGEGSGKNWLLANGIVGGLVEMNAGAYSSEYNEQQHTADVLELDYTLLLRMLNMWIN